MIIGQENTSHAVPKVLLFFFLQILMGVLTFYTFSKLEGVLYNFTHIVTKLSNEPDNMNCLHGIFREALVNINTLGNMSKYLLSNSTRIN